MPDFHFEKIYQEKGAVFGIDEAGRGPWCGPVVAACVYFPEYKVPKVLENKINDSKKLSKAKREEAFSYLVQSNAIIGIGKASNLEIDSLNILQASFLAMHRALKEAEKKMKIGYALIDGNRTPKWEYDSCCIIKGDSYSYSIAAASIIAKVTRDNIMQELSLQYPMYGWDKNAGYGTKMHIEALKKYGLTPYHRFSYAPIKALKESVF